MTPEVAFAISIVLIGGLASAALEHSRKTRALLLRLDGILAQHFENQHRMKRELPEGDGEL